MELDLFATSGKQTSFLDVFRHHFAKAKTEDSPLAVTFYWCEHMELDTVCHKWQTNELS